MPELERPRESSARGKWVGWLGVKGGPGKLALGRCPLANGFIFTGKTQNPVTSSPRTVPGTGSSLPVWAALTARTLPPHHFWEGEERCMQKRRPNALGPKLPLERLQLLGQLPAVGCVDMRPKAAQ